MIKVLWWKKKKRKQKRAMKITYSLQVFYSSTNAKSLPHARCCLKCHPKYKILKSSDSFFLPQYLSLPDVLMFFNFWFPFFLFPKLVLLPAVSLGPRTVSGTQLYSFNGWINDLLFLVTLTHWFTGHGNLGELPDDNQLRLLVRNTPFFFLALSFH